MRIPWTMGFKELRGWAWAVLFIGLKLMGIITWDWPWVLALLFIYVVFLNFVVVVLMLAVIVPMHRLRLALGWALRAVLDEDERSVSNRFSG